MFCFVSSALGVEYTYSSKPHDQTNIISAVMQSIDIDYYCINSDGIKEKINHTIAQMQQVFFDFAAFKKSRIDKFYTLVSEVEAATTKEELNLIIWS